MMIALCVAILLDADPTYADLSRSHGLGAADRLLKDGKYLEAAVAYRNQLLEPGEREGVRIPLALALLAKGDAMYAGIEIRRAHMLYPAFLRLVIRPEDLLGARGVLAKAAAAALQKDGDGDGAEVNAIAAYAFWLDGERDKAQAAIDRYAVSRGTDEFAKDMKAVIAKPDGTATVVISSVKPPAPLPKIATPAASLPRGGAPVRVGIRFVDPDVAPRQEIFSH